MRGQNQYDNPKPKIFSSFNNNFTSNDSPAVLDLRSTLNRNSIDGYVKNSGNGSLTFQTSDDGTIFNELITLRAGETFSIRSMDIDTINVVWTENTKYEVIGL